MRNQILVAMLLGVAIWSGLALNVEAPKPAHRIVKPQPTPASYVIQCSKAEFNRVCAARDRTEKVKQRWASYRSDK